MNQIRYAVAPPLTNAALNTLFAAAWSDHNEADFQPVLKHSLTYIASLSSDQLVGFVNVAWDGGIHAFILDTTVHPAFQRQGIGVRLMQEAATVARQRGIHWLHVDYEPHLETFYRQCGFQPTQAGLLRLKD
ncbi:MAG: GNAT family N-acetyltransferase [Anaerolineae bacterium]